MPLHRSHFLCAAAAALLLSSASPVLAQGVTTGAISGTILNDQGQPVESAQIEVVNRSTGARNGSTSRSDGRYFVQGLEVGGPYTVTVRRIGFAPRDTNNVFIALGQNARVDLSMVQSATQLVGVQVTGASSGVISSSHKGIATTITDSVIARFPSLTRNFTDFVALTPQISTKGPGNSGGGQNNRFNGIQIDGSVANDLFGLGSTGQPGGQAGAKQISLEAVKEYQVLLSPFDVRQGNFTGALVNAVTKSGSNQLHGSATYANRSERLERDISYLRAAPFTVKQEGFWLGGPILKDKLLFSVAPEWQQQNQPASGPYIGQPATLTPKPPVTSQGVDSLVNILTNQYGFADPGNGGLVKNENPLSNLFARLDLINLPKNSRLVARYNYVDGQQDILSRSATRINLSNNGYNFRSTTNSYLTQLFTSAENGTNNELLVGLTRIRDKRITPIEAPFVVISRTTNPNGGTGQMSAGTENSSQGNELDQDITEFTDNLTIPVGNHRFTIGTKNEFFKVRNLFSQNSLGNFTFGTLDSLVANTPSTSTLGIKLDNTDGAAHFKARTLGFYAEDEWQTTTNLSTTFGLRLDLPGLVSSPGLNLDVQNTLGINTTAVPKNVKQWSPRFGFNWDVTGDQRNQLRGGSGVFVGRPAYVWLSNLFGNSGVNGYGNLVCNGANSPKMPNAGTLPAQTCTNPALTPNITANTVDPDLKFPSVWRSSLGYDRLLPWNVIGTFEAMYTRSVANFYYQNIGLVDNPIGFDRNGRALYGDIPSAAGNPVPSRKPIPGTTRTLGDVIHLSNTKTHDYAYSFTEQLQKRFSNSFEGSLAYTYGRSYDVWDLTSSVAFSNWSFGRSYSGRQDAQDLYPSKFDVPHRVIAGGTYTFPTKTDVSFSFVGESGVPFEYVYGSGSVGSDINGDGSTANDLVYVPKDAHDPNEILFQQNGNLTPAMQADSLEKFISSQECLNSQRGKIMLRNSCRTPWTKFMNASVRQSLPTLRGQNFILQLDIFNFLNLLNKKWGAQDLGSSNSPFLLGRRSAVARPGGTLKWADGAQSVFIYTPFQQFTTTNPQSNYALQLQLKYAF
jgi:hypothetical protein